MLPNYGIPFAGILPCGGKLVNQQALGRVIRSDKDDWVPGFVRCQVWQEQLTVRFQNTRDRWVIEVANLTAKRIARLQGNEPDGVKQK